MSDTFWHLTTIAALACLLGGPAAAGPDEGYHVAGVRVSASGRLAIVNGQIARPGERVDGAEILSIDIRGVRLRAGSQELTAYVGSRAVPVPAAERPLDAAPDTGLAADTGRGESERRDNSRRYGPVARGETLSQIAETYLGDGLTRAQVMVALFGANPDAFAGNVNVLLEGAMLRVPSAAEIGERSAAAASTEMAHQHALAGRGDRVLAARAPPASATSYGPVRRGETLSEIGARLAPGGVTLDQMMIALFDANPVAFGGNIHTLLEGASLQLPDARELGARSPPNASAEVARHTRAWRSNNRTPQRFAGGGVPARSTI